MGKALTKADPETVLKEAKEALGKMIGIYAEFEDLPDAINQMIAYQRELQDQLSDTWGQIAILECRIAQVCRWADVWKSAAKHLRARLHCVAKIASKQIMRNGKAQMELDAMRERIMGVLRDIRLLRLEEKTPHGDGGNGSNKD